MGHRGQQLELALNWGSCANQCGSGFATAEWEHLPSNLVCYFFSDDLKDFGDPRTYYHETTFNLYVKIGLGYGGRGNGTGASNQSLAPIARSVSFGPRLPCGFGISHCVAVVGCVD